MIINRLKLFGMCPAGGCIQKDPQGRWRVISNKTGKYWPAHYKSSESAHKALEAYHASR